MNMPRYLAAYTALMLSVSAEPAADRIAVLEEAARAAGIPKELVLDPRKRSEFVEALRRRIAQGYFDEKAFSLKLKKQDPPKGEYAEFRRPYLETRATGFDRALFLASELQCVELVPLLVERGDMQVLDFGVFQKRKDARAVKAIVAMGIKAVDPLFNIVERSLNAQERYYAILALQVGMNDWKDELGGKGLADRMEERCDTSKTTVQLALALLKGNIHDARTAAGADLDNR